MSFCSPSTTGRKIGSGRVFPLSSFGSAFLLLAAPVAALAQSAAPVAAAERVVVTANRSLQPLTSVLADVSVVDRETIERSGALGVADLLARLPGIEFTRNGGPGATTGVFIRGGEARHAAVYIDGVRLDSQATGGAAWEQIPLDQIERVEVLRGPAAALYGSDAVAGVVQFFTKRGQGTTKVTASLTAGSYGTALAQAGIRGASGPLEYAVSASHGRSEGFNARTTATTNPDNDGWRRRSAHGQLGFQANPAHRIDATLLTSTLRAQFDGFSPGVDDLNLYTLTTGSLGWQGRWSDAMTTRLQWGQTRSTLETQPSFYRTESTLRNLTLQHEQRIGRHKLQATLERRTDDLANPATAFSAALSGSRHQDGVGLGWQGNHGDHAIQTHWRHDQDSEFGGKSTGSVAWGWSFLPQWRVSAAAATSFRAPTLYQRFSQYGNAALVPETGRNVELGLRWAAEVSEVSLRSWRNKLANLINFGSPGPCLDSFGCYANVGRAQLDGVTLAGRTAIGDVALRASLDWHDPRNLQSQTILQRRARKLASFGADIAWTGWNLGAEVQAAGARFEDSANTQRMGGYGLLNLIASTTLMRGLSLQVRIDNLGDKAYEVAQTYATAGQTAQLSLRWALN